MAHYAEIGVDNVVKQVVCVRTKDCMTDGGIEQEAIGRAHLENTHGGTWIKCSYNTVRNTHKLGGTPLRANYPSKGGEWFYDSTNDIFHKSRPKDKDGDPCNSWTLNTTTGVWDPPITIPATTVVDGVSTNKRIQWDESVYQADTGSPKTLGWIET